MRISVTIGIMLNTNQRRGAHLNHAHRSLAPNIVEAQKGLRARKVRGVPVVAKVSRVLKAREAPMVAKVSRVLKVRGVLMVAKANLARRGHRANLAREALVAVKANQAR